MIRDPKRYLENNGSFFSTSWVSWSPVFGGLWWVLVGFSLREEVLPGGSPPGRISSREDFLNVCQLHVFVAISHENRLFQIW